MSDLVTESKVVVHFPDFLLSVTKRQELINLLDYAIHIRNISFTILVLFYLERSSVKLVYHHTEKKIKKITGPWRNVVDYVLGNKTNAHYDSIFKKQFFDLNQHENMGLDEFVEILCDNFTKYQRYTDDGQYQIIPREKQKSFLKRIVRSQECFHFSEVGSGKTKVILPLLCQLFLSNNKEAHAHFARGGKQKHTLVVLVPEHLRNDARTQVFKYCLNLNFREQYKVYDDIFALLHDQVHFNSRGGRDIGKKIFVTSFNQFKKALTYEKICSKVWQEREQFLVVTDEVDDFLDRDKLVFNICSNKANNFDRPTLALYYQISSSVYRTENCPSVVHESSNPEYWSALHDKFGAIHHEIYWNRSAVYHVKHVGIDIF